MTGGTLISGGYRAATPFSASASVALPSRWVDSGRPATVLVVDDHPAVRKGLQALLEEERGIGTVLSVASYSEALTAARSASPDIGVVDFHLANRDGLTLARRLKAMPDPPRVLVFSAYADQRLELAALVSGADGVLSKHALGVELCDRIKALARGQGRQFMISGDTLATACRELDPQDRPILGMLAHGTPLPEIATVLGMKEPWLDVRLWAILERLKAPPPLRSRKSAGGLRATTATQPV